MHEALLEETPEAAAVKETHNKADVKVTIPTPPSPSRVKHELAHLPDNNLSPSKLPDATREANAVAEDRLDEDENNNKATLLVSSHEEETPKIETTNVESTSTRKKRFSNIVGWIVAAVIILTTIIISNLVLHKRGDALNTDQAAATVSESSVAAGTLSPEQRASVVIEVVQKGRIQSDVTAPGKIAFNGNRISPVFSQFNGRLVRLDAEVGANVRAGQVIGTIDTPDIVSTQADYQQALTNERSARTLLDFATRTRQRAERLAAAEAIPLRELQQAQADEARAKDDLTRAQSTGAASRGRLQSAGMSEREINNITAGARPVNRLVPLIAPISGTVTERKAGLGQVVQPTAGDPLLMIADLSSVWVNADVYEDQLAGVHVGAGVRIQTPAYPNETFAARVDQIGSVFDADKHTVAVRCVVPNPGARLKPGMFANVILSSAATQIALTVPATAVFTEGDARAVFIEDAPGHYVKRNIVTGGERDGIVIVPSGLNEGERVVVRGGLLVAAQQGAE